LKRSSITEDRVAGLSALNDLARARGQSLAQMAIAWVLRDKRVTSALVGVRSLVQLEENLAALDQAEFTEEELMLIDEYAAVAS
jgi:L-glyceraldehyde 3-phosphate reductase